MIHDNSLLCSPVIDLTTEHPPLFDWILLKMEHLCMSLIFKSVDGTCAKKMLKHAVFILCQHNFLKLLSQVKLLSSKSFRKRRTWQGRVVEVQGSRHMQHIPVCFGSFNVASKMLMFWFIHVYSFPPYGRKLNPPKYTCWLHQALEHGNTREWQGWKTSQLSHLKLLR